MPRSPLLPALAAVVQGIPQHSPPPHSSLLFPGPARVPVFCLCRSELEQMEVLRGSWSFNEEGKGGWLPATLGLPFRSTQMPPHSEMSSLILCTRDRRLSPPQLRVHTRWLQLPSERGNEIAAALWLGPLCFLSPLLPLQKLLVLYHGPALWRCQPAVCLRSALNIKERWV